MKKMLSILLFFCAILNHSAMPANVLQKNIHTGWQFKQARLTNWYPAAVPGVVHTDLMNNGIIEDPFFRLNERGVQWVDKEDWIYETSFSVGEDMFNKNNIRLHFKGLDTYADVYLNDEKILEADNMFREWKIDVKKQLKKEGNKLRIYFHSPIKIDMPKWDALPFQYEAGNDQSENGGIFNKKLSVFARKAGYHYGWDWGPRLVTSGVWRPVILEAWDGVKIENVYIRQKNVTAKQASITNEIKIHSDNAVNNAKITVRDNQSGKIYAGITVNLSEGENIIPVNFSVKNPKLWWSNGLGEAHLYEFKTEINLPDGSADENITTTGIRSIKIITGPDEHGTAFYFELNGVPVFSKGANFIPCDNFLPRITKAQYEQTILDAANANMNTLRVWGGGIYEDDYFYELCDKYGIMVWQDFMFACSLYPAEGKLLENIKREAIDNIERLRNHPSIALWCGNNENLLAWFTWGWQRNYRQQNPEYEQLIWKQYEDVFHKLLPEIVSEHHAESFYWPSSPFAFYDKPSDEKNGDRHYWGVWHAKEPIARYNVERSRFFSEYGFQSFPEFESVKVYAPNPEDWSITSEVMMAHQRGGAFANSLIEDYLLKEYQKPTDFQSFLYMNHVLQGDAIKTAIEAHRRDMPYCMGSLYWQHNDCWPVASWASRDYYGRWKAQHYFARKAFDDVLVSPVEKDGKLEIFIVSDRQKNAKGTLEVDVMRLDGELINKLEKTVTISANTSKAVFSENVNTLTGNEEKEHIFISAKLTDKNGKEYTNNYFLLKQKDIRFPKADIKADIRPVTEGFELVLQSEHFARAVFLSVNGIDNFFEDNYFDLLPRKEKSVKVKTGLSKSDFEKQLKIVSLSDVY
jgi:beta-mannosidase